jgi:hypothetical protein
MVDGTVGLRVAEDDEEAGVDLALHGELAYVFRERSRAPGRALAELSTAELTALREQLVLEAAAKVLDSIRTAEAKAPDP